MRAGAGEIERAGRLIARAKRMIACWAMGLTQHRDAVATIRMLVNVLLLGGHIGVAVPAPEAVSLARRFFRPAPPRDTRLPSLRVRPVPPS